MKTRRPDERLTRRYRGALSINAVTDLSSAAAILRRADQNSSSSEMLVRFPSRITLRFKFAEAFPVAVPGAAARCSWFSIDMRLISSLAERLFYRGEAELAAPGKYGSLCDDQIVLYFGTSKAQTRAMSTTTLQRYFFNIREGDETFKDEVGHHCPTLQAAESEAAVTGTCLLRDSAARGIYEPVCVEVTDDAGEPLVTVRASIQVQRVL